MPAPLGECQLSELHQQQEPRPLKNRALFHLGAAPRTFNQFLGVSLANAPAGVLAVLEFESLVIAGPAHDTRPRQTTSGLEASAETVARNTPRLSSADILALWHFDFTALGRSIKWDWILPVLSASFAGSAAAGRPVLDLAVAQLHAASVSGFMHGLHCIPICSTRSNYGRVGRKLCYLQTHCLMRHQTEILQDHDSDGYQNPQIQQVPPRPTDSAVMRLGLTSKAWSSKTKASRARLHILDAGSHLPKPYDDDPDPEVEPPQPQPKHKEPWPGSRATSWLTSGWGSL